MKPELKQKFPQWTRENKKFQTILTDDIDSLLGCAIENKINDNQINGFYDFESLYIADPSITYPKLGIDLSSNGACWDNHVSLLDKTDLINPNAANINMINKINKFSYYNKFAGSTALMMWSFYDLPLPKTRLGQMVLLSIDSSFAGHYSLKFKERHNNYLKQLNMSQLIDLLNQTNINDYRNLIKQYKLNSKIYIDGNGHLQTELPLDKLSELLEINIELPGQSFQQTHKFKRKTGTVDRTSSKQELEKVISFAMIDKKKFVYTTTAG